jgi:hypothetical protein
LWSEFESDVVEGRYPLGKLVRSEGRCGWFETRFHDQPALISLTESLNDEAALLERLRAAEKVKDKNVAAIFETGTTTLRDSPLAYAVMEPTEENLEDVLRTRALSPAETKEVAESLVHALEVIHKERLVCGRLEAAGVLAAGDTIKLRSDHLYIVPPDADLSSYAAKDVSGLGTLLWQCLTQRLPKGTTDANDPSLQLLPQPFVQIVRKALNGKATLEEIAALLHPSAPQPAVSAKSQPVAAAKASVLETTSPAAKPAQPPPKPSSRPQIPLPLAEDDQMQTEKSSMLKNMPKNAVWILAGFVVLLFVAGFAIRAMLHSSDHGPASSASPTPETPAVVVAPSTPGPSKPATVARPEPAKPKAVAATVPMAAPATGTWRVVAFTYNHQDQAEHKASTINSKHPDLQASVFSPKGNGAPYLVTLGSATDRESAFHLRGKAIQEGMPHDTFAQNYSR